VDNVTADNILNIREFSGDMVTITGTVGGDAKLGDKVTLDIGGAHYETTVIDINGQLGFQGGRYWRFVQRHQYPCHGKRERQLQQHRHRLD
jgi:hypothetical protein